MRKTSKHWLGREFVSLTAEARAGLAPGEAARALLDLFERELAMLGLSLENTIRTRLWARDVAGRRAASDVRVQVLAGKRRSASSSFICPERFDSEATVALDLLAMRPRRGGLDKVLPEYEPPLVPLRYLVSDDLVVLSGVTSELEGLAAQLEQIVSAITASLADAGSGWNDVVNVDCFVHRSLSLDPIRNALRGVLPDSLPRVSYSLVDGYSHAAKLCEVEVTAQRRSA